MGGFLPRQEDFGLGLGAVVIDRACRRLGLIGKLVSTPEEELVLLIIKQFQDNHRNFISYSRLRMSTASRTMGSSSQSLLSLQIQNATAPPPAQEFTLQSGI